MVSVRGLVCVLLGMGLVGGALGQRLPGGVRPEHYALRIAPDLKMATFSGTETVDVVLDSPMNAITVNAAELGIESVSAGGQRGEVSFDGGKEQATFTFARALPAGRAALEVAFSGVLNGKLRGFYLSKSKVRSYAVTQFEATDARRAFPCFDEPGMKATFDVSVTVDAGDTAISNMKIVGDVGAGFGKHTLTFATTPRMSTYLVAWLVGDFACTQGKAEGIPIRVCATPDKVGLTGFALKGAEHYLKYYDKYFGIKYPLAKLDLIAIPDFEAGAMENFGAITYRETGLLVDGKHSSVIEKKRVAVTVAHEMAHQWFGDLVTMGWWDNLWLNEGFATWMETKAAREWQPGWEFAEDEATALNETLDLDAARTTRAIRARAETPAEIGELFDGIAYGKAGTVIGMVENWVGAKVFQVGVHEYLAAHLYGNAAAEDFWGAQTRVSGQPVDRVMQSFVDEPGVPVVRFGGRGESGYLATEGRFRLDAGAEDGAAGGGEAWTIPVCVRSAKARATARAKFGGLSTPQRTMGLFAAPVEMTSFREGKEGQECSLLDGDRAQQGGIVPVPGKDAAGFFYANARAKGYYRVAYKAEQVRAITAGVETLSAAERIGFLGERWALVRADEAPVGEFLDLALAVKGDPNAQVVDAALSAVGQIRSKIATAEERKELDAVVRAELGPVYAGLGAADKKDRLDRQQIRTELFETLGESEDPAVLAHAREVAENLFAGKKTTEPDIVDVSVALAAAHGDRGFYEKVLYVSQKANDPSLAGETLGMLTRFHEPILVIRTLEYAVSGEVRNQDAWELIARELSQPETRELAWAWVRQHWDKVQGVLTTGTGANVVAATGSFCTVEGRVQVGEFFRTHPVAAADRALRKALESIDACVRLRETQEPRLGEWLAGRKGKGAAAARVTTTARTTTNTEILASPE